MTDERLRELSRKNIELAENFTQLEFLNDHWHQELLAARREIEALNSKIESLQAELQLKDDKFEVELQLRVDALEAERIERMAIKGLAISDQPGEPRTSCGA